MTTDLRVWVAEGDAERVQPVHATGMTGADAEAYARTLLVEEFRDRKLTDDDLPPDTPITATLCAAAEHYARQDHDFVFLRDMGMALTQWGSLTTGQARGVLNPRRSGSPQTAARLPPSSRRSARCSTSSRRNWCSPPCGRRPCA